MNDNEMKERARADLHKQIGKELDAFSKGKLKKANLGKVSCQYCEKKAAWAQYRELPSFIYYLLIGGFIGNFVNFILFDNTTVYAVCSAIAILPLIVALIVVGVQNAAIDRKVKKLPEESRPKFFIPE